MPCGMSEPVQATAQLFDVRENKTVNKSKIVDLFKFLALSHEYHAIMYFGFLSCHLLDLALLKAMYL